MKFFALPLKSNIRWKERKQKEIMRLHINNFIFHKSPLVVVAAAAAATIAIALIYFFVHCYFNVVRAVQFQNRKE